MSTNVNSVSNSAYSTFRGINKAAEKKDDQGNSIIDLADDKAKNTKNASGVTVALEDFEEVVESFHGKENSNITVDDTKDKALNWLFTIGKDKNIFKTDEGKQILEDKFNVFQDDIYQQDVNKNDGIKYLSDADSTSESAQRFAKADINAIETAFSIANPGEGVFNDSLDSAELHSYLGTTETDSGEKLTDALDLDGKSSKISDKEYASYLLAADTLKYANGDDYDVSDLITKADGTIDSADANLVKNTSDEDFKKLAQGYYDKYFD